MKAKLFINIILFTLLINVISCGEIKYLPGIRTFEKHDSLVYVQGQTIRDTFKIHTIQDRIVHRTDTVYKTEGKEQLKIWQDKLNNIEVLATRIPDTLRIPIYKTIQTIIKEKPPPASFPAWGWGIIVLIALILIAIILKMLRL